jgi:hypothetical protein
VNTGALSLRNGYPLVAALVAAVVAIVAIELRDQPVDPGAHVPDIAVARAL